MCLWASWGRERSLLWSNCSHSSRLAGRGKVVNVGTSHEGGECRALDASFYCPIGAFRSAGISGIELQINVSGIDSSLAQRRPRIDVNEGPSQEEGRDLALMFGVLFSALAMLLGGIVLTVQGMHRRRNQESGSI